MTDIGLSCFILNFAALFIIHDPIYGLPQNTFFLMALITTWNISGKVSVKYWGIDEIGARSFNCIDRSGKTIIIVDDSKEVVDYLVSQLSRIYTIITASDGKLALELAVQQLPTLIITDIVMPGYDGIELLRRLKSNVVTNHIPVVVLSGRSEIEDKLKGLGYGADAYIPKPFRISELEAIISSLISNRLRLKGKYSGQQEQTDKVNQVELPGNDDG